MTDNPTTPPVDNQTTQTPEPPAAPDAGGVATQTHPTFSWKTQLGPDLGQAPFLQTYEDTPEGLQKAFESHDNLQKLIGHEKVPIPKSAEDVDGWNRFAKAMGIPDAAEGYGLPDAEIPESMKQMGVTLDKNQFAEIMHAHKVHPDAVKGIWEAYVDQNIKAYDSAMQQHQGKLEDTVNQLRSEWGDAYETNVELGQAVINQFSDDQEMNDYLTSMLTQDPRGVKFMAKIGNQFAENQIGEFKMRKFSMEPAEAQEEIDKMTSDLNGPYMNQSGAHTERAHQEAIARVNHLRQVVLRAKQGQA